MRTVNINTEYHKIIESLENLKKEVKLIDDDMLLEEIMYTSGPKKQTVDKIVSKYISKGNITKKDREKLEWFYITSYI